MKRGYFHFLYVFPETYQSEVSYKAALSEIDIEYCKNLRYTERKGFEGGKNMATIKCPKCGKEFDDNFKFCPECGYSFKDHLSENDIETVPEKKEIIPTTTETEHIDVKGKTSKTKKKAIVIGTVAIICCLVVGGLLLKKDPMAKKMIEDIDNIGKITLESEAKITELEKTYSEMTEKQKNQVSNYVELKSAREKLDKLIDEENERLLKLQQAAAEKKKEKVTSTPYKEAITFVQAIKDTLYNPESLQVHSVKYIDKGYDKYLVDYSGENKLGGSVRTSTIADFSHGTCVHLYEKNDAGYNDELLDSSDSLELDVDLILEYVK